jgi:AmmeMemoRadiSam system radical SAM enzyme/AmmeMemoRadiSam system protein B/AmmeMemoRadiSam system protein A
MSLSLPVISNNDNDERSGLHPGQWWRRDGERIICDLCPRECAMKEGDRGFCFVRQNLGGEMKLTTYGRSTGFCIDPIEKKPLNHFFPGTSVLSFGTAGCNLGCKFCQNWDISKAREVERLSHRAMPEEIALAAKSLGCHSVAYTYNDPIIWAEYVIDTAKACREVGVKSVAVTAGYITEQARGPFFEFLDAANVDLKAFTEEFYYRITYSHLEPVLDTLKWLKAETDVWFEITNLIIPDANDKPDEIRQLCDWVLNAVGDEVPVHFSAFHPDYRMLDKERTPHETLIRSREIAIETGLKFAYVGNVNDVERQSTYCPSCRSVIIERNWYELGVYALNGNQCQHCGHRIAGQFADRPGTWGRKRQPVDMSQFHIPSPSSNSNSQSSGMDAARSGGQLASPVSTGATMNTEQNDDVKINESALQWLAGGGESKPVSAPAPAQPVAEASPTSMALTTEQRDGILKSAAELVKASCEGRRANLPNLEAMGIATASVSGIFVSLKRNGQLRSCCGSFGPTMPLLRTLQEASHRTATNDPRFPPISTSEIPHLDLEVWLLFAPERVQATGEARIDEVEIGKHGLQIVRGNKRGLLLPGVATDNNWNVETFLNQVCVKAGLPSNAWLEPDTVLFRFEGNVIKGGLTHGDETAFAKTRLRYAGSQIDDLCGLCHDNINAVIRGATPMPYCGTVPDSTVNGISLTVTLPGTGQEIKTARMSLRDPMPLQSSAFSLCEELAASLRRRGFLNGNFKLDLSIAYDAAMHGTVAQPSLDGIDTENRTIMVSERAKTAWYYNRGGSAESVLAESTSLCQVNEPVYAQVFSLAFQSTAAEVAHSAVPKPVRGTADRQPAVAGKFYPGDPDKMNAMLDELLAGESAQEPCQACMVPHAGWQFSGKLAADVLKRIPLPKRIIIIGPKHTQNGSEWAVAPHHQWLLPGQSLQSDYELAERLASTIDGLEMDSAAHHAEHGIEVDLPIIARLSPESKVVGIAVSGGNLDRCDKFAEGLANVVRGLDEPPLLVISSDMNHYASDEENRRLDQLALNALDRLDEDALFDTCRKNQISMCGMIPAVIVLKTLKKLGGVHQSRRVGYATSADVSGDTSRVVGYAGRIFQ